MNRIKYWDGLRLIACFIIYTTHFIAAFNSNVFVLWSNAPSSYILNGISGKFGVALLAVILGYFSFSKGEKDQQNPNRLSIIFYSLDRYFYFVICGFIINLVYYTLGMLVPTDFQYTFLQVFQCSILLSASIFPTFWCMRAFLSASIIGYIIGRLRCPAVGTFFIIVVLIITGQLWISICLFGVLMAQICFTQGAKQLLSYTLVQAIIAITIFLVIKRPESPLTYAIDGICSIGLCILCHYNAIMQRLIELPVLSLPGKNSMTIYLFHPVLYSYCGPFIFQVLPISSSRIEFVIAWILCWLIILLFSIPSMYFLNHLHSLARRFLRYVISS